MPDRVAVDGFWMYTYEVTNEQYAKFVKATGHREQVADSTQEVVRRPEVTPLPLALRQEET